MSKRTRRKHAGQVASLLPPDSMVREYAVGQAHARMTMGAIIAIALFVGVFVTALALGVVVYPGVLLLLFVSHSVRPPRGIAATDQGVVLVERRFLTGKPSKVLALGPGSGLLSTRSAGRRVVVAMGPDRVTMRRSEYDRLLRAVPGSEWPVSVAQAG